MYLPMIVLKGKCNRSYAFLPSSAPCSMYFYGNIVEVFSDYDVKVFEESMTDGGGSNFSPLHNVCGGFV